MHYTEESYFRVWECFIEESRDVDIENIRCHLGLDRCKLPICACALVSKDMLYFFHKCGIKIIELYGMTECGVSVTNGMEDYKLGSVGRPIAGTQIKINSNTGEVIIKR